MIYIDNVRIFNKKISNLKGKTKIFFKNNI